MNAISNWLAGKLKKYVPDREGMDSALYYGVNMALYTLLSTAGLILIGWLMGEPLRALLLIALFYLNQTLGGGYHADSHLKCFLTMSTMLVAGLLLLRLRAPDAVTIPLAAVAVAVLMREPIVLHPNRYYLKDRLPAFARRSRIVLALEAALYVALILLKSPVAPVFSLCFVLCAISRVTAKVMHARRGE